MTDEQANEILKLLRETREFSKHSALSSAAHLVIAEEYKKNLGDPLEKARYVGKILKKTLFTIVGIILTVSALAEWWNGFLTRWFKP